VLLLCGSGSVPVSLSTNQTPSAERASSKTEPNLAQAITPRLIRLISAIPPYSWRAVLVVVVVILSALAVQIVFRLLGGTVMFSTYFPAVLVAGLLAGLPAGVAVTIGSLFIVWWAFMPPTFTLLPLARSQQLDLVAFIFSSACVLAVTECYRAALVQLRKNEKERELVMKELEHRGRNTYAVIDAIIRNTFEDQPERAKEASGRIRAVEYANDLMNECPALTVPLKTLLLHEFIPYGEARFRIEGADIELPPDTARHLALAFHELVTNAAKYGALSNPSGRVLISSENVDGFVRLEWREEGGPATSPPKAHGFGSRVVTQSLKSISGSITPTFGPKGLHCSITFQVKQSS
jgi:two-component sensor histidine kinase